MKSIIQMGAILGTLLLIGILTYPQTGKNHSTTNAKKSTVMEANQTQRNKEILRNLYENIMNNRKLDQINNELVSDEFVGVQGGKGAEGFRQTIQALLRGFPDAHWKLDEMIAEGNKVMIRQTFTGTH